MGKKSFMTMFKFLVITFQPLTWCLLMSLSKLIQCHLRQRDCELMHLLKLTRNPPRMSKLYGWACWSIVQWEMVQSLYLHKVPCCNPCNRPQKLVHRALVLLWPKHTVLKCCRLLKHYYFPLSWSVFFISSCQRMFLFYPYPFFWCPNLSYLSFTIAPEKWFKRFIH